MLKPAVQQKTAADDGCF